MRYKFIRTNYRPIEETDYDYNIRQGFLHCLPDVKARLEAFFSDPTQDKVTFEFEGQTVTIKREAK